MNTAIISRTSTGATLLKVMLTLSLLFCVCVFTQPSQQTSSGGTGSEIVGTVVNDSSGMQKRVFTKASAASFIIPVRSGNVFCFQRSFVPDTTWARSAALPRALTDSAGGFIINDAPPGEIMVEVDDGFGNGLVDTLSVLMDSTRYFLDTLFIKKNGAITIQAQTQLSGRIRFYVGVKGTHLVVRGSQTGLDIRLDNVPSGVAHTVCIRVYEPVYLSLDIPGVTVSPSMTTVLQTFQIK